MTLNDFARLAEQFPNSSTLPVLFIGHGSPMNAIEQNEFTRAWEEEGKRLPRPKAILCVSAHWYVPGTFVHGAEWPKMIYDFYGFPQEMYNIQYDCPGAPDFAKLTQATLQADATNPPIGFDLNWGIDHGTWVVMKRLFPAADVPVFQLSIDYTKPSQFHYDLAKQLSALRRKGVLIVGSGNIVHNLMMVQFDPAAKPYDWATEFDQVSATLIAEGNHAPLINYQSLGKAAELSIPTPDHYWPMLYSIALREPNEQVRFFANGVFGSSVSMRSFIIQ